MLVFQFEARAFQWKYMAMPYNIELSLKKHKYKVTYNQRDIMDKQSQNMLTMTDSPVDHRVFNPEVINAEDAECGRIALVEAAMADERRAEVIDSARVEISEGKARVVLRCEALLAAVGEGNVAQSRVPCCRTTEA